MNIVRLTIPALERSTRPLILLGLVCCIGLALASAVDARTAARAVLYAWLYWIGLAAGSAVLLAIHALTGGRWGEHARPALRPAAHALVVLVLPFIVVATALRLIYPWAGGDVQLTPDVASIYLNPYSFVVRGCIILAVWTALGLAVGRRERVTPLWAGIGLALYLLTMTIAAIDWSASLAPQWTSTSYGFLIGVSQGTTALAFAALLRSGDTSDSATADLGSMLLAAILGMTYLEFMQLLVIWSSGLPEKTIWYELRADPNVLLIGLAFLVGVFIPFFLLIQTRLRADAAHAGFAGLLVLVGLALFWAWEIAPGGPRRAAWVYPLAFVAVGAAWLGIAFGPFAPQRRLHTGVASHV